MIIIFVLLILFAIVLLFKKEAYFNNDNVATSFHTTRDIKEICEWNEKELKLRKDKLVNKINEIINIF